MLTLNQHPEIVIPRTPLDPSLVFWAPFYELDGASFASKDAHGHLCTRIGAIWTPQGDSFDGTDDYVRVQDINFSATNITFEVCAQMLGNNATNYLVLMGDRGKDVSDSYPIMLDINWSTKRLNAFFDDLTPSTYVSTDAVPVNKWVHLAMVYVNGVSVTFYQNGRPDSGGTLSVTSGTINDVVGNTAIGADRPSEAEWTDFFNGLMSDALIYNRALSPIEVMQDYLQVRRRMPWLT